MNDAEQREEAVFEAALQLQGPERAAYLNQVCASDPALRQRIEGLLGALERAGSLLNEPAVPWQGAGQVASPSPSARPGDYIGSYKLLQQIGEGGCGVVYMAEQVQPVKRRVALKILKLGLDTKQVIARFEAERQALALMDHPNIAKILDAGTTEVPLPLNLSPTGGEDGRRPGEGMLAAGRPYFVMELVRGVKITEFCDEQQLPMKQRLELFIQVCQAIQHAHQKGIVHRDIKPSNILVTINDGVPVPKVIDFGIAKAATGQVLTDKTLFTAFEQFIGTPAYMSPEQAVMTSLDVDTRSDIYSLGVLLYELLTGKTPFDTKELLQAGLDEMRRTIREVEPVKPSTRLTQELAKVGKRESEKAGNPAAPAVDAHSPAHPPAHSQLRHSQNRQELQRLIPALRGDLDWIVMKTLEKDRARRYETANGLVRDIERHLHNEPVMARPPGAAYRFQKLVRRNKGVVLTATVVAVALLIGLGISVWQAVEKSRAYHRASASERFLNDLLNGVGPSVALGRDTTLLLEIVDKTAERAGKDYKGQPEVEAALRSTLGNIYHALGKFAKAEAMFREALAIQRRLQGHENLEVANSLDGVAKAMLEGGKSDEPEALLREALAIKRKLLGKEHEEIATSLSSLAAVFYGQGRLAESEALYREALSMRRKLLGNEGPEVAFTLSLLGFVLYGEHKLVEAEATLREALALQKKLSGDDTLDIALTLKNLADVFYAEGKLAEAETTHREALAIRRKLLPKDHPYTAASLNDLALVLTAAQKLSEAEAANREALAMYQRVYGSEHPEIAIALGNLGALLLEQGKSGEAEARLRESPDMMRKVLGEDHPNLVQPHSDLARLLLNQGRMVEAEASSREALRLRRKSLGDTHPLVARSLANLIDALLAQEKFGEAEPLARECLAIRESQMPDDPLTFNARSLLGACLLGEKRYSDAEPLLLSGYEGLKQREARIPAQGKYRLKQAMERLVQLYEATNHPDRAAEWKQKLREFENSTAKPGPVPAGP